MNSLIILSLGASLLGILAATLIFYSSMGIFYDRKEGLLYGFPKKGPQDAITRRRLFCETLKKNKAGLVGFSFLWLAFLLQFLLQLKTVLIDLNTSNSSGEGTDWLTISTAVLAFATIFLAIFTLFLFLATRKYATAAENQVAAMNTQVSVMNSQTSIMEKQKEIVQKQADAAERQAKAVDDQVKVMGSQRDLMDEQKKIAMDQMKYESSALRYHRLRDEMDKLVAPLNSMVRTGFEYYEPVHLNEKYVVEGEAYWKDMRKNAYLASDNLYEAIEKYFKVCEKQKEELRKVRYEIHAIDSTPPKILNDPAPVDEGFEGYLREIEKLRDKKGPETDYGKKINWLHDIVQDGHMHTIMYKDESFGVSVRDARIALKDAIEARYKTLLKHIKDVEKDLGIPT